MKPRFKVGQIVMINPEYDSYGSCYEIPGMRYFAASKVKLVQISEVGFNGAVRIVSLDYQREGMFNWVHPSIVREVYIFEKESKWKLPRLLKAKVSKILSMLRK